MLQASAASRALQTYSCPPLQHPGGSSWHGRAGRRGAAVSPLLTRAGVAEYFVGWEQIAAVPGLALADNIRGGVHAITLQGGG